MYKKNKAKAVGSSNRTLGKHNLLNKILGPGEVWRGKARPGEAWLGEVFQRAADLDVKDFQGTAWRGVAGRGMARRGEVINLIEKKRSKKNGSTNRNIRN